MATIPLTCPVPSNINPLQSNGFLFSVVKLPTVSYFCQEVNLPSLTLPSADFENSLVMAPIPGEKLDFGELDVTFMMDENMTNYIAIHNWMIGLGFPESWDQYKNYIAQQTDGLNRNELLAGYSDGNLQILGSDNKATRTIHFVDMFPTSLGQLTLESTTNDTQYLAGRATFKYSFYRFE